MPSKLSVILRSAWKARLEARKIAMRRGRDPATIAASAPEIPLSLRREDMGRGRRCANRAEGLIKSVGDEMDYANCRSLPAMFFEVARQRGARPFLWAKRGGKYHSLNWSEAADSVTRLARGLVRLGIEPGDRVALI